MARRNVVVNGLNERLVVNPSPVCESPFSSTSSIGLSADVVPVSNLSDSFTSSPRLSYLRALSGRMVTVGLPPLEPPAQIRSHPVLPFVPGATGSSILPMLRMSESHPTQEGGHKVSSIGIIFTLWNTMMGSTLLVMPYTFQQAGWLLALVLSMLCAVIAQFTCGLILTYAEGMMADPSAEFADLARLHFGQLGRLLAFLTGNVVVMGAAVAMHGYSANVLEQLVEKSPAHGGFCFKEHETSGGISPCSLNSVLYPTLVLVVVLPLANLPSIRLLAKLNTIGVFCFMIILGFAYTSAIVAGVDVKAFETKRMIRPQDSGIVFGIFSLSFFIHNAVMTIMRGAAKPSNNKRDLGLAFLLTWFCYASMGISANLCPPHLAGEQDAGLEALAHAKNGMLSLQQPPAMAPVLILARIAVLMQSLTVYPVLLFIVRSQLFTAFIYKRPYPGPLPTLIISCAMAAVSTTLVLVGVQISDVLKFAGAAGGLVCVFGLPALIHGKVSFEKGTLNVPRVLTVLLLCGFGIFCVVMQVIPGPPPDGPSGNSTGNGTS